MATSNPRLVRSKSTDNDNGENTETMTARARKGAETMERDAAEMADTVKRNASDLADTVSTKLKTVGVDTDVMATAAKDQATELQRMIAEELQAHPLRALGLAAAVGVFVGLMTSR